MRLLELHLRNFKGIRDFSLDAGGKNVTVFGDNGAGKTTLADAFMWLLFGKDSANRATFDIKTLNDAGEPLHGLEHSVEARLDLGKEHVILRKVYQEKWTKKRGSATKEFTGHTIDHFINDVPVKQGEYQAKIQEIADESVFRLLTDPRHFCENLHWQERRKILLEVCGDVSDKEVIASRASLKDLPDILGKRSLEEHRKIIQAKRTEINRELDKIPVRIDEVRLGLPDIEGIIPEALTSDIEKMRTEKRKKEQALARLESGGETAEKTKRLREIEAELLKIEREHRAGFEVKVQKQKAALLTISDEIAQLELDIRSKKHQVDADRASMDRLETKIMRLRDNWHRVNGEAFDQPDTCPTCGQALPEEAMAAALAEFNQNKAERLGEIRAEGKEAKTQADNLRAGIDAIEAEIKTAKDRIVMLTGEASATRIRIDTLTQQADAFTENPKYKQKFEEAEALKKTIETLSAGDAGPKEHLLSELKQLEDGIMALEEARARVERHRQGTQRIKELKAEERNLAAEFERLEKELYLTEEFVRAKVGLLEDRINGRFALARFRLFNVLINGGVEECCEVLYQGVPYSTALNNGARINVGLDIINTLSDHYGFEAPVWLDNREAVTRLIETKAQLISLVVSEKDRKLRVETDYDLIEEAV